MKSFQVVMLLVIFIKPAQLEESQFADLAKNITSESQHETSISKDNISNETIDVVLQENETSSEVDDSKVDDVQVNDTLESLSFENNTSTQKDYRNITNFQEKLDTNETDLESSETRSSRGLSIDKLLNKEVDFLERRSINQNRNNSMLVIGIPVEAMKILKSAAEDHLRIIESSRDTQAGLEGSSEDKKFPLFHPNGYQGHHQDQNSFHKENQGNIYNKNPKSQTNLHHKEILILSYEKPKHILNNIFKAVNIQPLRKKKQLTPSNGNYEEKIKYGIGQESHLSNFHDIRNNYNNEKILLTQNSPSSEKGTFTANYQDVLPYINSQILGGIKTKKQFENYRQNKHENSGYPQETTAPIYQKPKLATKFQGDMDEHTDHKTLIPLLEDQFKPIFNGAKYFYDRLKQLITTKIVPSNPTGSYPNFPFRLPNYVTITRPSLIPLPKNKGYSYGDHLPFTDFSGLCLGLRTLDAISNLGKVNKGIGLTSGIDLSKDLTFSFSIGGGPKNYGFSKGHGRNIQIYKEHHDPFYTVYNKPVYRNIQSYSHEEKIGPLHSGSAVVEHIRPNIVKVSNIRESHVLQDRNKGHSNVKPVLMHSKRVHSSEQPVSQFSNNGFINSHLVSRDSNKEYDKRELAPQDYSKGFNVGQPIRQSDGERQSSDQLLFQDYNVGYHSGKQASRGFNEQSAPHKLNKARSGSQLISESFNVENSPQIANGRYTREPTTIQGSIVRYPGDQQSYQSSHSEYNSNNPLLQSVNEKYNQDQSFLNRGFSEGQHSFEGLIGYNGTQSFRENPNSGYTDEQVPQYFNHQGQNQQFSISNIVSETGVKQYGGSNHIPQITNVGYSSTNHFPQAETSEYVGIHNIPQDQNMWHSVSYQDPLDKPNFLQQNPNGEYTNLNTPQSIYHDNSDNAKNKNIFAMKTFANRADLDGLFIHEAPNDGKEDPHGFHSLLLNENFKQYKKRTNTRIKSRNKPTRNIKSTNLAKGKVDKLEQWNVTTNKSEVNIGVKRRNLRITSNSSQKKKVFPKESHYQSQQKSFPLNETKTPISTSQQKITNKTTNNKIVKRNFPKNQFSLTSYDFKPEVSSSWNKFKLATENENVKFIGEEKLQQSEKKEDTIESLGDDFLSKAVLNNNQDIPVLIVKSVKQNEQRTTNKFSSQ